MWEEPRSFRSVCVPSAGRTNDGPLRFRCVGGELYRWGAGASPCAAPETKATPPPWPRAKKTFRGGRYLRGGVILKRIRTSSWSSLHKRGFLAYLLGMTGVTTTGGRRAAARNEFWHPPKNRARSLHRTRSKKGGLGGEAPQFDHYQSEKLKQGGGRRSPPTGGCPATATELTHTHRGGGGLPKVPGVPILSRHGHQRSQTCSDVGWQGETIPTKKLYEQGNFTVGVPPQSIATNNSSSTRLMVQARNPSLTPIHIRQTEPQRQCNP